MKQWRFEVFNREGFPDVHGSSVLEEIKELGISSVEVVQSARVFLIEAIKGDATTGEGEGVRKRTEPTIEEPIYVNERDP